MNTKERILKIASMLFFQKGIDRTSIKQIADKAGVNIAAVNYHFKSKENLVDLIFERTIMEFSPSLPKILLSDKPLEDKIRDYISTLNDLLLKFNPDLPFFIMNMMQRNPKKILSLKITRQLYHPEEFYEHIKREAEKGNINPVDPQHFFMTLLSLIGFPFSMQHILMGSNNWTEDDFVNFIKMREDMIFNMIMKLLKDKDSVIV